MNNTSTDLLKSVQMTGAIISAIPDDAYVESFTLHGNNGVNVQRGIYDTRPFVSLGVMDVTLGVSIKAMAHCDWMSGKEFGPWALQTVGCKRGDDRYAMIEWELVFNWVRQS
jgi:hypothetical protein